MHSRYPVGPRRYAALLGAALLFGAMGCKGDPGDPGPAGPTGPTGATGATGEQGEPGEAAPTTGVLTGKVTDAVNNAALGGVTVTVTDTGGGSIGSATTNDSGDYNLTVPFGVFKMAFTKADFTSPAPLVVGCLPGSTVTINVTMAEAASGKPTVTLTASGDAVGYGNQVTLTATATDPQGDALTYAWSNTTGGTPQLGTVTGTGAAGTVTMPTLLEAFSARANSTNPGEYINEFVPEDRFGILPIMPDYRAQIGARVTVSDGRGQSTAVSMTVNGASVQTGLPTVALLARVYMNAGAASDGGTYAWTFVAKPTTSTATISNNDTRYPSFIPDVKGTYKLQVVYTKDAVQVTKSMSIEAGDWAGAISGTQDGLPLSETCTGCHNGTLAVDKFTAWRRTPHATIFSDGIDGFDGTSGSGCLDCHTVGNDKGAANSGFDDMAKTAGWSFPATADRKPGVWAAMFDTPATASIAKLANIQCESCHGPNQSGNHSKTRFTPDGGAPELRPYDSPRVSYAAETCGTCHARTSHHLYQEWSTPREDGIGHSNLTAARDIGARAGILNNHCGRCHSAQGFVQYAANLENGISGNISKNLSQVTKDDVQPITCQACHDSHDATNPRQLRLYNDIEMLPSGFGVHGFGKGALCASCHNSRNGLRGDQNPPTSYSAPHVSAQTDVFSGKNAFFVNTSMTLSNHAAIEDTCVGCHMERNPQTRVAHGEETPQGHLFRINDADVGELCQSCHAEGVNGEAIRESVHLGLEQIAKKIEAAAMVKINAAGVINVRAYDGDTTSPTFDLYSSSSSSVSNVQVDLTTNPVTHVELIEGHGQIELHLTFTTPISVQFVDASGNPFGAPQSKLDFGVQLGSLKDNAATPAALWPANSNFVKAGWNYFLIHADASEGMHNPSWVKQVIAATLAVDVSN